MDLAGVDSSKCEGTGDLQNIAKKYGPGIAGISGLPITPRRKGFGSTVGGLVSVPRTVSCARRKFLRAISGNVLLTPPIVNK